MKKLLLLIISLLVLSVPLPTQAEDYFNDLQERLNEQAAIRAQEQQHKQEMAFAWVMGIGIIALGVAHLNKGRKASTSAASQAEPLTSTEPEDDALKELRLRYAKGEISEEEYLHRVGILKK